MDEKNILNCSVLDALPSPDKAAIHKRLLNAFQNFSTKIVILDDDPTGTQTVHDVPVYTDWSVKTFITGLCDKSPLFFILTNSRSFSGELTEKVHREIGKNLTLASKITKKPFLLISRGDSTLRGHYPSETAILKETIEAEGSVLFDGEIICPFFLEGGRYTLNNIHYIRDGGQLIPVGMTEFARDKTFSYTSSHLGNYIEEKTHGCVKADDCIYISLSELRNYKYREITDKLAHAADFAKIIVNAADYCDLEVFMFCLLETLSHGKHYIIRSAASLVRTAGNISEIPLLTKDTLHMTSESAGGLIMVGSHVKKTTEQLEALLSSIHDLCALEFSLKDCSAEALLLKAEQLRRQAEALIAAGKTVVIFTTRQLVSPKHLSPEASLQLSVDISDAFTEIIRCMNIKPRFLIAKGGITSSDIITKGLAVKKALVLGQIQKGIPVWQTDSQCKFPNMPYIIFPGNVGQKNTLCELVKELL